MSLVGSQGLIDKRVVASSHDISDEGIIVALLEMAFACNCGICVDLFV
jgi:phosphoribosylformylglycinamidine synthase